MNSTSMRRSMEASFGDGDFEPLYKFLIKQGKQVLVIYTKGHLGREIWNIEKGLFKAQLKNLMDI